MSVCLTVDDDERLAGSRQEQRGSGGRASQTREIYPKLKSSRGLKKKGSCFSFCKITLSASQEASKQESLACLLARSRLSDFRRQKALGAFPCPSASALQTNAEKNQSKVNAWMKVYRHTPIHSQRYMDVRC